MFPVNSLQERRSALSECLGKIKDKDEKLKFIIELGKSMDEMDVKFKLDQFLVKGCISKAWLFPKFEGGKVQFMADSEAMIVKGIIAVLLEVYNNSSPDEILSEDGSFLAELGITEHLSMNRRNGLSNVLKMIHNYAGAFKAQSQE